MIWVLQDDILKLHKESGDLGTYNADVLACCDGCHYIENADIFCTLGYWG